MNEQLNTPPAENPNNATCSRRIPTIVLVWTLQAKNQLNRSCNRVLQHFKIENDAIKMLFEQSLGDGHHTTATAQRQTRITTYSMKSNYIRRK